MDEHALADVEWKPRRLGPLLDVDARRFQSFDLRSHSLERSAEVCVGGVIVRLARDQLLPRIRRVGEFALLDEAGGADDAR